MTTRSHTTKTTIEQKLLKDLDAVHVAVEDESWKHAGHTGARMGGGHFAVDVVSSKFEGLNALDRRRLVFQILREEMQSAIHALSVRAYSPSEWPT
ncbi:MAG: BolA family protein [Nitrospirota bacterium]